MRKQGVIIFALAASWSVAARAPARAGAEPGPERARVVELSQHRRAGVVTARMSGGASVHVRRMTALPTRTTLVVSIAGGELLETGRTRGLARLAAGALGRALLAALEGVGAGPDDDRSAAVLAQPDAIMIRVVGDRAWIDRVSPVLASVLASPRITHEQVKEAAAALHAQAAREAQADRASAGLALVELLFPVDEARVRPVSPEQYLRFEAEDVRRLIHEHLRAGGSPIELGVAGEVSLDEAFSIASVALSGVPERPAPGREWRADLRRPDVPQGPLERTIAGGAPAGRALVITACLGIDPSPADDIRALRAGARILDARLRAGLERAGLADGATSVGSSLVFSPYRGFGMLMLWAIVPDGFGQGASALMGEEVSRLLSQGPAPDELTPIAQELARDAAANEADPVYWGVILSRTAIAGLDPQELAGAESFYRSLTPERVREVLARRWKPEARVGLVVLPDGRVPKPVPAAPPP